MSAAPFNDPAQDPNPYNPNAKEPSGGVYQTRPFNPTSPWDMANVDQWQHIQQAPSQMPPGFPTGAPPSGNTGVAGGKGFPNSSVPGGGGVVPSGGATGGTQYTPGGYQFGGGAQPSVGGAIGGTQYTPGGYQFGGGVQPGGAIGGTQYTQGYQFGGVRPRFGGMLLKQLGV